MYFIVYYIKPIPTFIYPKDIYFFNIISLFLLNLQFTSKSCTFFSTFFLGYFKVFISVLFQLS